MTREEALKVWLPIMDMGTENMPECKEALQMAIKALKQEPILDKIRAEIEEKADGSIGEIADGLYDALEIIDKHISGKAESEVNNG